ncbi:MAG: L-threonylcarbamoyladenylate synthase [Planctomycetaceae bacterium]
MESSTGEWRRSNSSQIAVITQETSEAAQMIRAGGLVAFPTETVYGLGGNALDVEAVARIFSAKERPHFDPLIVHAADAESALSFARDVPDIAIGLAAHFWPGPLTLLLPKKDAIPDLVTAGLPDVGLRVPDHPFALAMLREAGCPVAAPSANPFGRVSPTTAIHVMEQLGHRIDMVLDGGPCRVGIESTVLRLGPGRPSILRHGGVTQESLEAFLGPLESVTSPLAETVPQTSPGQLLQHYSPRTPLSILPTWDAALPEVKKLGGLAFQAPPCPERFDRLEVLSPTGDFVEATARFFAALRSLDASGVDLIVATPFPQVNLGRALNDRLFRAAAKAQYIDG